MKVSTIILVSLVSVLAGSATGCSPYAYIAHSDPGNGLSVSIIDTGINSMIGGVSSMGELMSVAVNPADRVWLYAGTYPSDEFPDGHVRVVDTRTNTVFASIPLVQGEPQLKRYGYVPGIAVAPNGSRIYAAATLVDFDSAAPFIQNFIAVIDAATLTVIKTVGVGRGPYGVAVSPNGSRVYVANSYEGTVSVIDTATNSLVNTIPAGGCLTGIAVSPNSARVYVTAGGTTYAYCQGGPANLVHVIDTAKNAVVAAVPTEDDPQGLVVTPDGSRVYVANSWSGSVNVINTASNTVVATIGVPNGAWNVDVVPLGTHVYAHWSGTVSVISTASNLIVNTVQVASISQTLGRFIVVPLVPIIPDDGGIRRSPTAADRRQTSSSQASLIRIHYGSLLRDHAPELSRLLSRSPLLRAQGEALLRRLKPQILAALDGQTVAVYRADLNAVETWIRALATDSSPGLRATLEVLLTELRSPAILRQKGILTQ